MVEHGFVYFLIQWRLEGHIIFLKYKYNLNTLALIYYYRIFYCLPFIFFKYYYLKIKF